MRLGFPRAYFKYREYRVHVYAVLNLSYYQPMPKTHVQIFRRAEFFSTPANADSALATNTFRPDSIFLCADLFLPHEKLNESKGVGRILSRLLALWTSCSLQNVGLRPCF